METHSNPPTSANPQEPLATAAGRLQPPQRGEACPACGIGRLDYNGLLELECPLCGYRDTGGTIGT